MYECSAVETRVPALHPAHTSAEQVVHLLDPAAEHVGQTIVQFPQAGTAPRPRPSARFRGCSGAARGGRLFPGSGPCGSARHVPALVPSAARPAAAPAWPSVTSRVLHGRHGATAMILPLARCRPRARSRRAARSDTGRSPEETAGPVPIEVQKHVGAARPQLTARRTGLFAGACKPG